MNLADLKKSVTEMSDGELIDLLREIRASRRTATPRAKAKSPDSDPVKLLSSLDGMSETELGELATALEAMLGEDE